MNFDELVYQALMAHYSEHHNYENALQTLNQRIEEKGPYSDNTRLFFAFRMFLGEENPRMLNPNQLLAEILGERVNM